MLVLLTACSRMGIRQHELDYATSRYFQALHPAVLEEFHQIADALGSPHEDYFTAYPDAKAAYGLVQIPDILEQNLEPKCGWNC